MPKIDLCFQGWLRGVDVSNATQVGDGEFAVIDVSQMSAKEFCEKLRAGELVISLVESLDDTEEEEIELFDFEPADKENDS